MMNTLNKAKLKKEKKNGVLRYPKNLPYHFSKVYPFLKRQK